MQKIVINVCHGGFGLSPKAEKRLESLGSMTRPYALERTDPMLVRVVEELGNEASGRCARLKVVEVPDDVEWEIDEYDGWESVHEKHRSWG